MQKAIVIGANGFIGTNLTKSLSNKGIQVLALVDNRFDYHQLINLQLVKCVEFSLESLNNIPIPNAENTDIIYHLAWEGVNAKYRNEVETQTRNILHGLRILDFAKKKMP